MARTLTVNDVLNLDTFEDHHGSCFSFSPDGSRLVFAVQRSMAEGVRYGRPFLAGNDRGELLLADVKTGEVRSLVNKIKQGVGAFAPAWSPDGTSIAVAMVDAHAVRLELIDSTSGRRSLLSPHNLALPGGVRPYEWLDAERLVCALLPGNAVPLALDVETRGAARAMQEWPKAWAGHEPTASVLDSPPGEALELRQRPLDPDPTLVVIDARSGALHPLPRAGITPHVHEFRKRFDPDLTVQSRAQRSDIQQPDWISSLPLPDECRIVGWHGPTRRVAVLTEDDRGSHITILSEQAGSGVDLFETNTHLRDVRAGTTRDLPYRDRQGRPLTGRLLLPPDYTENEARPAVVWVYPGAVPGPTTQRFVRINYASPFNLQLLAARGFVVIEPSLPLPVSSDSLDLLPMLAESVVPAVEAQWQAGSWIGIGCM